jgi:hypothetical protein
MKYKAIIMLQKAFCFICRKQIISLMKRNGFINPEMLTAEQLHRFFFRDYSDTNATVH